MKLIITAILLCISCLVQAEETLCIPTKNNGVVHILRTGGAIVLSQTGAYVMGKWQLLGDTQIFVKWDDGDSTIYPKEIFQICNL